jgi:hypothetical protein
MHGTSRELTDETNNSRERLSVQVDSKLVRFESVRRETGASGIHAQVMRGTDENGQYKR